MKATELRNELRVGNKVRVHGHIATVEAIAFTGLICNNTDGNWGNIVPLPLTEEWLLKFGFTDTTHKIDHPAPNHKAYELYKFHIKIYGNNIDNYMWYNKMVLHYAPIQYVHQLQNLYFALTGEELTLK